MSDGLGFGVEGFGLRVWGLGFASGTVIVGADTAKEGGALRGWTVMLSVPWLDVSCP